MTLQTLLHPTVKTCALVARFEHIFLLTEPDLYYLWHSIEGYCAAKVNNALHY
jgi:hypothetical protein